MSGYAVAAPGRASLAPFAAITGGALLLLLRAQATSAGGARVAALVVLYAALVLLSLVSATPDAGARRLSPVLVTAIGAGAVTAVTFAPWQIGVPGVAYGAVAAGLGVLAAFAEEAFFRRLVYGWIERWWGPLAAVVLSAAAFALVHLPLYGVAVLWLDLGAGILLSWQRWASGSWGPSAATHAVANLLVVVR